MRSSQSKFGVSSTQFARCYNVDGSLLGLPELLSEAERTALLNGLARIWESTMGQPPGDVDSDLEACRRWFDPVAQGQRLRRQISELPLLPTHLTIPAAPMTLRIDDHRALVTPEGRCALDLLLKLEESRVNEHVILPTTLVPYERRLARLYQRWSRHRLESVLELLAGGSKPLQIPAAGVIVALLVNRCDSEDRALTRFADGEAKEIVDRAFFAPVQAFSDVLSPSGRRNRTNPKLVSGWMLYEARRRLGEGLVVVDARQGANGKVWIRPERREEVLDRVCSDLARGHRTRANPQTLGEAYDALVDELRKSLPTLAGFGLVHERRRNTEGLRRQLVEGLNHHLLSA